MKKLWYCLAKDIVLSIKGLYFYMEVGMALIFVAVMIFAVPETSKNETDVYAHIETGSSMENNISDHLIKQGINLIEVSSREDIVRELENNRDAVGLHIEMIEDKPVFEYILQGYEDEKFRNMMETSIKSAFASQIPGFKDVVDINILGKSLERLNNRTNILPIFMTMNAAFMGLFIIASYIFLDKEEGTIKALTVTPVTVWQYLLSKLIVMLITGIITSMIVMLFVAGSNADYLLFIIALIAYNCFGSALGLFIASFFNTMSKAMGWLYFSIILLAFAAVSYFMPAFSPLVIRLLPSYPMLFSFREILLKDGDAGYVLRTAAGFFTAAIILFYFSNSRFKKTITV